MALNWNPRPRKTNPKQLCLVFTMMSALLAATGLLLATRVCNSERFELDKKLLRTGELRVHILARTQRAGAVGGGALGGTTWPPPPPPPPPSSPAPLPSSPSACRGHQVGRDQCSERPEGPGGEADDRSRAGRGAAGAAGRGARGGARRPQAGEGGMAAPGPCSDALYHPPRVVRPFTAGAGQGSLVRPADSSRHSGGHACGWPERRRLSCTFADAIARCLSRRRSLLPHPARVHAAARGAARPQARSRGRQAQGAAGDRRERSAGGAGGGAAGAGGCTH